MAEPFTGFPCESIEFFKQLAANNNRDWFQTHKDIYERYCRTPMRALVVVLEPRFGKAKISRINRDVRFSRDRAPYKNYIAAGVGRRYISLSAEGLYVGAGLYRPDPALLHRFRAAIDDNSTGRQIQAIVRSLRRKGYKVDSHEMLSSGPRGYSPDHPRLGLLRMKDIFAGRLFAPAPWLSTPKALGRVARVMNDTGALVTWLEQNVIGGHGKAPHRKRQGPRRAL